MRLRDVAAASAETLALLNPAVAAEWRAKIAPRAVGIGSPECSVIGVSEREVRLAHELEAAGLPITHNHPRITVDGRGEGSSWAEER